MVGMQAADGTANEPIKRASFDSHVSETLASKQSEGAATANSDVKRHIVIHKHTIKSKEDSSKMLSGQ